MPDDYSADTLTDGSVAVGGSASGDIESARDFDWFAVELVAGRTYVIDIEGDDTGGGTLNNVQLRRLYDADGNRIAHTRDRDSGSGDNARLTFTATETETHYIEVRAYRRTLGTYTVRVTDDTPDDDYSQAVGRAGAVAVGGSVTGSIETVDDRDWFAVDFVAGKAYRIKLEGSATGQGTLDDPYLRGIFKMDGGDQGGNLIAGTGDDDSGTGANSEVIFVATESATNYIAAGANGSSTGTYKLSVAEIEDDYAAGTGTAGAVTVGASATGDIQFLDDRDWFAVTLVSGTVYRIELEGSPTDQGTLDDPHLRGIHDPNGNLIAGTGDDDGGVGYNSKLVYAATESGTHYIAAGGYLAAGGDHGYQGTYKLSVTAIADDYAAGTGTAGAVTVGESATGELEYDGDHDWFAVTLVSGTAYRIKLEGSPTDQGTLDDPYLRGIYDPNGNLIAGTGDDDGGVGYNSELVYAAAESGTHYIAAASYHDYWWSTSQGTYKLSVTAIADDYAAGTGTAAAVTVGASATGELEYDGDRDWFAVTLEANTAYRIDVKGDTPADYGGTLHNPSLKVHDSSGDAISLTADDNSGVGLNARLSAFTVDADGDYFIEVSDPGGLGTYTVSVSAVATDSGDDYTQSAAGAGSVAVGGSVTGDIETVGDLDWFAMDLVSGTAYRIKLEGSPTDQGTLDDPYLRGIYKMDGGDQGGNLIAGTGDDDGGVGYNSKLVYAATESGTHYIAAGANGSSTGTYKLSVAESEDDYAAGTGTAGAVAVGASATGELEYDGDHDWFAVDLVSGTAYRIKLEGSPTDQGTLDDPYLRGIHDPNGNLIAGTGDDDGGVGYNSKLVYAATESGTHYIAAGGYHGYQGTYKLSVTAIADDYAAGSGTAGAVTVGASATGELEYDGDRDWFAVTLEANTAYRIDAKGDTPADYGGTLHNPSLKVHDSSGDAIRLAADDNSGVGLNARLSAFTADADGTYYIEINDPGGRGTYTVSVEEVADTI